MRIALLCSQDFNIGVSYVSAYYKSQEHIVKLFFDPRRIDISEYLIQNIVEFKPDMVGISCITANVGWALNMAKRLKCRLPEVRIVFGGVHPTLCPEDFREYEVFQGKLSMDYNLILPDREIFFEQLPPIHRQVQMFMTGFGCPFQCSFCNNHQLQNKIFKRSADSCIQELRIQKERGLKYVLFEDDIFCLNRNWLVDFLDKYGRFVCLPFTCFGHVNYMDEQLCRLLKENFCQAVWLGIQTGHEIIRNSVLNRNEKNYQVRRACRHIKEARLKLIVDRIFGLPYENNKEHNLISYEFYKSLEPDVVNCYELLYFPKTEINKYGQGTALYQKEGGLYYRKYAKSFSAIPFMAD